MHHGLCIEASGRCDEASGRVRRSSPRGVGARCGRAWAGRAPVTPWMPHPCCPLPRPLPSSTWRQRRSFRTDAASASLPS
eukprot:scaffold664_cov129-Isochrysis_galbana.AAC.6